MEIGKKIVIFGKVHNIGCRAFLLGIAESLEIKHFFADDERIDGKEAVVVLIRSSQDKVEDFISLVKRKKPEDL